MTVGLILNKGEEPWEVVSRMKKIDVWDPMTRQAVKAVHQDGFRLLPTPGRRRRVEWEADIP